MIRIRVYHTMKTDYNIDNYYVDLEKNKMKETTYMLDIIFRLFLIEYDNYLSKKVNGIVTYTKTQEW